MSWKPLTIPAGSVDRLYRFDANTIYGIGAGTLLRRDDGGLTFVKQAFGAGQTLTSIGCADPNLCLITTAQGALNRTTDGGATATPITASSVPLAGAAFASVGAGRRRRRRRADRRLQRRRASTTPRSAATSAGRSSTLRRGPVPTSAFAPGAKGQIALTADAGATWKVANVSTSADILDTSWSDAKTGYALDIRGGLFRTLNGGTTWQTLNAGAGAAPRAVDRRARLRQRPAVRPEGDQARDRRRRVQRRSPASSSRRRRSRAPTSAARRSSRGARKVLLVLDEQGPELEGA